MTNKLVAIFTSFQFVSTFPDIAAHVLTIVCIFLPFSAMWAGVAHDEAVASRGQQLIKSNAHGKSAASTMTNSSTVCGNSCQMSSWSDTKSKDTSSCAVSPTSHGSNNSVEENCIRVDRKFGFSHGDAADRV
jgi:pheromone alpha factor receptor